MIISVCIFPVSIRQVHASTNSIKSEGHIEVKPSYNENSGRLSVSGRVTNGENVRVTVKILNYSGNVIYIDEVLSSVEGSFTFKGPVIFEEGMYDIYVGSDITEIPVMVSFKVEREEPEGPGEPEEPEDPSPGGSSDPGPAPGPGSTPKTEPKDETKPADLEVGDTPEEISKNIEETLSNLDRIESDKLLGYIEKVLSKTDSFNEEERNTLKKDLGLLIEKVLEKAQQITISQDMVMIEDNKALAILDEKDFEMLFENISSTHDIALNKAEEYKLNIDLAKEVNIIINVPPVKSVNGVTAKLPSDIFNAAANKGIDNLIINTQIGSIAIGSDALYQDLLKSTENIELVISIADKGSLSADAAQKVGDSPVYDISMYADGNMVSTFNNKKAIEITLPYTLREGEDPDKIIAYYINNMGQLEVVKNSRYYFESEQIVFTVNHLSKYTISHSDVSFDDIAQAKWAKTYIEALAAREIVNGVGNGCFEPNRSVTRAEFAKMLTEAFDLVDEKAETDFDDVSEDKWYYVYVASAYQSGIVKGTGGNYFQPDALISREDMAVMAYRAINAAGTKLKSVIEAKSFGDMQAISDYALEAVTKMQKAGIIAGTCKGNFEPKAKATRAEAAKVIYLLFKEL